VKQEKFKPYNDVLDLIDEANRNKHGGDRKSENFKIVNHHLEKNPMRQSTQSNLRRLRDYLKRSSYNSNNNLKC